MGSSAKKSDGSSAQKRRSTVTASDSSCSTGSSESSSRSVSSLEMRMKVKEKESSVLSPSILGWPIRRAEAQAMKSVISSLAKEVDDKDELKKKKKKKEEGEELGSKLSEMDMMKERFAKLLLGEDMSGSGKGACTALTISNAITNLCASIFGQLWRLEPLPDEKKAMWKREMEWLLCVTDHIVELIPSSQTIPDGRKLEVMTCRPRSDIFINLPALRKLDNMLLDILDGFKETEFWYVDEGIVASDSTEGSASFRKTIHRQQEKWWLPVPRVPAGGMSENSRKQMNHTRECACQILKAAMAINSAALSDMEVPESYLDTLPKHGRASLGDVIYRYVVSDQFSTDCLLDCLDLSSEHIALEIANRVEASIHIWRRRAHTHSKPPLHPNRSTAKPSWGTMVKDLMADGDKREVLVEKAERLLFCLKQRFPGLSQTILDASKIQFNKDVGKSIVESYSRVLESLAFNIVARIDDILYVDDLTGHTDKLSPSPAVNLIAQRKSCFPYSVSVSGTPYRSSSTFSTPGFSPAPASLISPARGDRTPFILNNAKPPRRGFGVRRVLNNYLGVEPRPKLSSSTSSMVSITSSITSSDGSDHHNGPMTVAK
ncbi:hypothetical protein MLD38_002654 [Melastoma candidum]|uniref:Uncharacterized protein n=1 Tax=Melastoma candidum TaxID=119954 RepID=A0ACB9RZQ3_9MYRT|nr:hypothetical protein MLD38_002654 [Melastoma candidum]